MPTPLYKFGWGNNPKRLTLKGRICVVLCSGAKRSVGIKFIDNGQMECVSMRSLRQVKSCDCERYEERAAIIEYDGGESRPVAERMARQDVCSRCEKIAVQ